MKKIPISICILTYNEESNLRACLETVRWAQEILVLDSGSTDKTVEIAKGFGTRLLYRPFTNFPDQRNYHFAEASFPWVFYLDADERVPAPLAQEIEKAFSMGEPACSGFSLPRLSYYLGRPIRHSGWYPDRTLRLFHREKAKWSSQSLHAKLLVEGKIVELQNEMLHYPYRNLSHHLTKMNSYTSISAQEKFEAGKRVGVWGAIAAGPWRFAKSYFFQRGFLDGKEGLALASLSAFGDTLKYLKLYELSRGKRESPSSTKTSSQ